MLILESQFLLEVGGGVLILKTLPNRKIKYTRFEVGADSIIIFLNLGKIEDWTKFKTFQILNQLHTSDDNLRVIQ